MIARDASWSRPAGRLEHPLNFAVMLGVVLTVYLDQNKWIDLGRARYDRANGQRYKAALSAVLLSLENRTARFPLSFSHYIETWRQSEPGARARLAKVMIELSQGWTMAKPPQLCDDELDAFIARALECSFTSPPVFGLGFSHINRFSAPLSLDFEFRHLARRPDGFDGHGRGHQEFGERYRDGEMGLQVGRKDLPKKTQNAMVALSAVMEISENIQRALERVGQSPTVLGAIGAVRPDTDPSRAYEVINGALPVAEAFIAELPTRDAALRLRVQRHRNPNNVWESNDLNDIAYLACAVVHCDVVVTEKQWVHELRQTGLPTECDTIVLSDLTKLPSALVAASRAAA